ncbi:hypothetical protein DBR32_15165 [Taibaiella sp. KBW10]|uniref:hypothetical protein n=1 Tax=Taibaiella sp. KBW10 TaxID=2153357 RepID=UPI000F59A8DC|nr:hypothetical protein [Taibaiella sp. KBW10]RQO29913.1 hypothetical protein DBR32_15165 [Taibaiella sp. KBW10]
MKNISILILALSFFACRPEKKKQFSNWKVNGVTYSSNNVTATIGRAMVTLTSHDTTRFDLRFYLGFFPSSGEWPIISINPSQDPNFAILGFYIDTIPYGITPRNINKLIASKNNNKVTYTLAPTWFISYNNPNDSVLIEGTFNEP